MRKGRRRKFSLVLAVVMGAWFVTGSYGIGEAQSTTEVTIVNLEFEGTKIWVPGPVVVKKGDIVRIKAINNVKSDPPVHGIAIEAYGIQALINVGEPETIEFKADKAGIFPIICHLHPPHVGTQLVVLE
jgi:nitrosocyanin